jgi:hypothetical protein
VSAFTVPSGEAGTQLYVFFIRSRFSIAHSQWFSERSPGAMALAATGDLDLAREVSQASARELKLAGVNWAFSPVADVNSDPRNPVIGLNCSSYQLCCPLTHTKRGARVR